MCVNFFATIFHSTRWKIRPSVFFFAIRLSDTFLHSTVVTIDPKWEFFRNKIYHSLKEVGHFVFCERDSLVPKTCILRRLLIWYDLILILQKAF